MVRSVDLVYPKNPIKGPKKGHIMTDDGVLCGSNVKVSKGGRYKITKKTQAPNVWCKTCERMATFPWEDKDE